MHNLQTCHNLSSTMNEGDGDRMEVIRQRLKEIATEGNQRRVAKAIGISNTHLASIISGETRNPNGETVDKIRLFLAEHDRGYVPSRTELGRQIDEVLSGPYEPWEKVLLVAEIAYAYNGDAARTRAEIVRTALNGVRSRAEIVTDAEAGQEAEDQLRGQDTPPPPRSGGGLPPGSE